MRKPLVRLQVLSQKFIDQQRSLYIRSVNLDKAFDRVCQRCILSPTLFNVCSEEICNITWENKTEEIKINGEFINSIINNHVREAKWPPN